MATELYKQTFMQGVALPDLIIRVSGFRQSDLK